MESSVIENNSSQEVSVSELRWQCRRGMLELDILLNDFIDKSYIDLPVSLREVFVRLLQYPDQTLFELLMNKMVSSDKDIADMVDRIRKSSML